MGYIQCTKFILWRYNYSLVPNLFHDGRQQSLGTYFLHFSAMHHLSTELNLSSVSLSEMDYFHTLYLMVVIPDIA